MTSVPAKNDRDALITGIGLICGLGEGAEHVHALLAGPEPARPAVEIDKFAPYPVIPMAELDLSSQIPRRGDQRQMGPWQRFGVYAAGLALDDAGIKDNEDLLGKTNLIVAAGGGERDPEADTLVLDVTRQSQDPAAAMAEPRLDNPGGDEPARGGDQENAGDHEGPVHRRVHFVRRVEDPRRFLGDAGQERVDRADQQVGRVAARYAGERRRHPR